jgi:dTDP-4-amino-4,6-dideoxygalactose transaminase
MNVPLFDLKAQNAPIREEIHAAMDRVCDSQHFILGPEVQALEEETANYCGAKFAVGVSSGSDAILAALMALPNAKAYRMATRSPYNAPVESWSESDEAVAGQHFGGKN